MWSRVLLPLGAVPLAAALRKDSKARASWCRDKELSSTWRVYRLRQYVVHILYT